MYLRHSKSGSFIILTAIKPNDSLFLELTDKQHEEVKAANAAHEIIKVIDGNIHYFKNEGLERAKMVAERNELLEIAGRFVDRPTYFEALGLSNDDIEDAKEYYIRLLAMPQHYDNSEDKQGWFYEFVEIYTSGKNTNSYQLMKPSFVK